jgi:hypothetical protein
MRTAIRFLFLVFLLFPLMAAAHVGSPDVYYDGFAGPYHLLVTVRPPLVIPGIAEIEIRSITGDLNQVQIVPLRLVGPGAELAPKADTAERSGGDPRLFTGKLWILARGAWKIDIHVSGGNGQGELAVPIAAASAPMRPGMAKSLGGLLIVLGLLLVVGLVSIVRAANAEGVLPPGEKPAPAQNRQAWVGTLAAAAILIGAVFFGDVWWRVEAARTESHSYKLPHVQLALNGNTLALTLENPNTGSELQRLGGFDDPDRFRLDDFIPDHGHLMHLFLVRTPDMKSFWHLHPQQQSGAQFSQVLPSLPAGHYKVFADIVHRTGFPETQVGEIDLPAIQGGTLAGDDAGNGSLPESGQSTQLPDGRRMVWERESAPLKAGQATWFRFRIEDKNGRPATDVENYMGMAGHAAFIRDDGTVFAHVHPAGSISMAAAELASGNDSVGGMDMAGMHHAPPSSEVSFPYGFPQSGKYTIFVQIKSGGIVETGAFAAVVE